jgi:hypothetical protein
VTERKIEYYRLEPVYAPAPGEFRIANASVGVCQLCGGVATGMGGSDSDVCLRCGGVLVSGRARGAIKWEETKP